MGFRIAHIQSVPVTGYRNGVVEDGVFELDVEITLGELAMSGDPGGFVQKTIAEHLAKCVLRTGMPLKEGLWQVTFTKWAQNNFNYPEGFIT